LNVILPADGWLAVSAPRPPERDSGIVVSRFIHSRRGLDRTAHQDVAMKCTIIGLVAFLVAAPAFAQEPVGCDKFKWPLDKERSMLKDPPKAASGSTLQVPLPAAVALTLVPFADAKLPTAPERAPRLPNSFAGFVQLNPPVHAGIYKVTLSSAAWIDVAQAGHLLKSITSSGATGCEGIRKSVKFDLQAEPFAVQISNVPTDSIGIAISGD
jgi:hypothetical protein